MSDAERPPSENKPWPARPEKAASAEFTTTIDGVERAYRATAATLNLKDEKGEDRASVFYVEYVVDGPERPLTFCFNGGPGSATVWLQFGAFGPQRVELPAPDHPPRPPYALRDNAEGLLDLTDLVFVDPVGTGFSRPIGEVEDKDFYSVDGDADSIVEFVWRYLTRNNRWNSPRFLAGESYGTMRAAVLADKLMDRGVAMNGLVLLSAVFNLGTVVYERGNDLPNVLFLPSYAATAWHHGKLPNWPELGPLVEAARKFAFETYAPALHLGDALEPERALSVAQELSALTSLDADDLLKRRLRIEDAWFQKALLGDGRVVGRLDSRYLGHDPEPGNPVVADWRDPSFDLPHGPYAALVNDFVRRTLGFDVDLDYVVFSKAVNEAWTWQRKKEMGFPDVSADLGRAMVASPAMGVFIASGYYDLATPFVGMEYARAQLHLPPALRDNVSIAYYPAGHMMYFHDASRAALRADLNAFYAAHTQKKPNSTPA